MMKERSDHDFNPADLWAENSRLRDENSRLRDWQRKSAGYIRDKVDQLLEVIGTLPLRPEELDDEMLVGLDPIGIVSDTFGQILENLRETNAHLALANNEVDAIFHAAGAGLLVLSVDREIVSFNAKLAEMFSSEIRPQVSQGGAEPPWLTEIRRQQGLFDLVVERREVVCQSDWQLGRRHYDVVGSPIFNSSGDLVQVVLVFNDITERRCHEQALADVNLRLDTIFDSVPAGILLIDAQSLRIIDANRQVATLLETPLDEIVGKECIQLICVGSEHVCPVLGNGLQKFSNECDIRTQNGRLIPVLKTVVPVVLDGRQFLLESFLDITERKKAEESVRVALAAAEDARAKTDGIIRSVADPLIVTDPAFHIVMMNRAAEKLLGLCLFESFGLPLEAVILDQRLLEEFRLAMDIERSGGRVDFVLPIPDGSGEWMYQGSTSALCDQDGRITGLITIMRNVTFEREVDRMKSEFVSTAAHELQTPLAAILGFSELLLSQKGDISPELEQESLTYIYEKADLLSKIVDDLLDISRIESGRPLNLNLERFNLKTLIDQVTLPYRTTLDNHLFEVYLPPEPVELTADRRKLEQVLDNILSNAFKYSPLGGLVRLSIFCEDVTCRMAVEDQGLGMTAEQKERMFDKFYRADASNTSIGGTGLGMSITKYFIEAHGGKIWVESELGQGTKVNFSLPLKPDLPGAAFSSGG